MDDKTRKLLEKYDSDYCKIASKDTWEPQDIVMMKDLQKLMYYIEVRDAMNGGGYEGGWDDQGDDMSYARGGRSRNSMGQYTSGRSYNSYNSYRGYGEGSGGYPYSYDRMNRGSGRRYYDSEKEMAIHELHKMMDMKDDPEVKAAFQSAIRELEAK